MIDSGHDRVEDRAMSALWLAIDPSPMGPPYDIADGWLARLASEAWHDLTVFLIAGLLLALFVRRQKDLPPDRKRLGGTVLFLALHILSLPVLAAISHVPSAYANIRLASLALAAIAGIHIGLILAFDGVLHTARIRPPRIILDVLAAVAYAVAVVLLLSARGVDLTGLITTSAVLTAVIGLSLQDTLGNVMGGMTLQLEQSLRVGDWIKYGEYTGKVVAVRWRQTTIETRNWETVIIPNSALVKSHIVILGRRTGEPEKWRRWIHFNIDFRFNPSDVIQACERALRLAPIEGVAASPEPNCILYDMSDSYNHYAVRYWLTDLARDDPTDSVVRNRIFFALRRANLPLTMPAQAVFVTTESQDRKLRKEAMQDEERKHALARVELFETLSDDELGELAEGLHYSPFAAGETLTRQGGEGHHLYLIVQGRVSVRVKRGEREEKVATLEAGAFFGERSLMTGELRSATTVAEEDTVCYRLDKVDFERLLKRRPGLAEEVAEVLARRIEHLSGVVDSLDQQGRTAARQQKTRVLVGKIREFFGL